MSDRGDALWHKIQSDPQLHRVLDYNADLSIQPTLAEQECLNQAFKLFQNGWRVAKATDKEELESLAIDIADFLKRPLCRAMWEQKKKFRNRKFVRFVIKAVREPSRK